MLIAGSSMGIAPYVWNDEVTSFQTGALSAQLAELYAVIAAFTDFPNQSFNIYTDRAYVAH